MGLSRVQCNVLLGFFWYYVVLELFWCSAAESCPFSPCPSLPGGVLGLSPACLHGSGGATAPPLRIILAQCCVRIIQSLQVFYEIINLLPTTQAVAASLHSQAEEQPMPLSSHMSHTGF